MIAVEAFDRMIDHIAGQIGQQPAGIRQRYETLQRCQSLEDILSACRTTYVAPSIFHQIELPADYFDLFYSYSVLQRVPPDDLTRYLQAARRSLKSSSWIPSKSWCTFRNLSSHN